MRTNNIDWKKATIEFSIENIFELSMLIFAAIDKFKKLKYFKKKVPTKIGNKYLTILRK